MALQKIPLADERQQPNVCTLSQNFTDCALALKSCAAEPAGELMTMNGEGEFVCVKCAEQIKAEEKQEPAR